MTYEGVQNRDKRKGKQRFNDELLEVAEGCDIVKTLKFHRFIWVGHLNAEKKSSWY